MSKRKKIAIWVVGVIGALLVLLLILLLLLPTLINLEPIKAKIVANLSQRVGGELAFQRCDLSFFPRPRVIIYQGSLSIPGKIAGTLEVLKVYPKILPLLRGRVQITMLQGEAPHFKMGLPQPPREKEGEPRAFSLATIEEEVAPVLGILVSKAPDLTLVVHGGRFDLTEGDTSVFSFMDIHGRISLPPDMLEIDLACNSNLWESISLEGWLDPGSFESNGQVSLTHFQGHKLTDHFFPSVAGLIGDMSANVTISFKTDGLKALQAEVKGSLPYLTMLQAKEKLVIKAKSLKSAFHMEDDRITISLTELDLDYPRLKMSGKLFIDQTTPRINLVLEGREVDLGSTRKAALVLAGKVSGIQEAFDFVRGGKIPLITVSAQGSSMAELGLLENILIKGSMVDGYIFIRGDDYGWEGVDLNLEDARCDVVISEGILEGKNFEAQWETEKISEGAFKLGLEGDDAPFHLEAAIESDLSQLDPVLRQLIKQEKLAAELARIYEIKGKAVGRVVVGERIDSITARVDVSKLNLFARYEGIPYGMQVNSGQIFYDERKIRLKDLNGTFGKSSFSEVTAQLGFGEEPGLEILSGRFLVILDEIYPWLSSSEGLKNALKDLKSVQGTVAVSTLTVKGPLLEPERWHFRIRGEVENLAVDSTLFPDPLTVTRAGFEATPERLSLTDCETGILDASLRGSGILHGYLEGLQKADFTLQGNVGPKTVQWILNLIDAPPKLRVRAPLSISRAQGSWKNDGRVSFAADIGVKDGPRVSIDMLLNPEELRIKDFLIKDRTSDASFALTLRERELHLDFKGNLGKTTLDGLLVKNHILTGRIQGDIQAHILLDHPMRSTARGKLQGVGLGHPLELKIPVQIENFSLDAKGHKLTVESALVTWDDKHLNLEGGVEFSEEEFLFDMNLSADGFEWEKVEEILEERDQEGDLHKREDLEFPPLRGTLGVKLGHFKYGRFTWRPFHAAVSFDHGGIEVTVTEANVCGISTPGIVELTSQGLSLDFKPTCTGQEPGPVLACLLGTDPQITGNLDLKGEIMSRAKPEELVQSLQGNFELVANKGRIYRSMLLLKIFGLINVTEIFRGKFPDLGKEGFAYDSFIVKANLQEGKLILKEAILDGSSMELVGQGEVDLMAEKMDLTVLVAPLKTVDFVVKKIPLVRQILTGTLVSIPVKVEGDLANPTVKPFAPSAVSSELTGIMKRIFRLPIKVIQPLRPGMEGEQGALQEEAN